MTPPFPQAHPDQELAQFSFRPTAVQALSPEELMAQVLADGLADRGPIPIQLGGRVAAFLISPEDLELMEAGEDRLACQVIRKAYEEQGDAPVTSFGDFLHELGI